jgi:hypothetical protein
MQAQGLHARIVVHWFVKHATRTREGEILLKRLMMILAMVALVLAVAVPALAAHNHNNGNNHNGNNGGSGSSVAQPISQESQTGNVTANFTANQSGNNSSQCVTPLQFGNTGSLQNAQGVLQYASQSGDIQLEGSNFTFSPTLNATCNQAVQQSAAASG